MARTTEFDKVRELQWMLYRVAKKQPERRFHALYDKVSRRDVLERAWVRCAATAARLESTEPPSTTSKPTGVARVLDELATDLKAGSWRPLPARRVFIPKPGTHEQRPLSIPTGA